MLNFDPGRKLTKDDPKTLTNSSQLFLGMKYCKNYLKQTLTFEILKVLLKVFKKRSLTIKNTYIVITRKLRNNRTTLRIKFYL